MSAKLESIDAILFDFDGVLVDSEPVHYACWREVLAPFAIDLTWDYYAKNCIGISDREMIRVLIAAAEPPVEFDDVYACYPAKRQMFRERMMDEPPMPLQTRELLEELAGRKLAVVTSSGQPEVKPILDRLNILDRFQATVYGGDVARLKPAPDPYLKAAELLASRNPLVLEDSAAGRESGRAAGFEVLEVKAPSDVAGLVRARLNLPTLAGR